MIAIVLVLLLAVSGLSVTLHYTRRDIARLRRSASEMDEQLGVVIRAAAKQKIDLDKLIGRAA